MTTTPTTTEPGNWPLWRVCLKELRSLPNFGYGLQLDSDWFESRLAAKRDTPNFAFQMLDLRQELDSSDGYYLQAQTLQHDETGMRREVWQIPSGADHQAQVANGFRTKMRSFAQREARILDKTLANKSAGLSDSERSRAESQLRIAATRLILLRREKSVHALVEKTAPKLLEERK